MKVLVIGSNGMAGHVIVKYLRNKNYDVHTAARDNADQYLDVEHTDSTTIFLNSIKDDYDYIINCIGLLVKDSIDRPDRAALINSWFPHAIEHAIKNSKTRLIHLSTDCVFDGREGNYIETDVHTEMNHYGRSKSLGEIDNIKDITFRMSIIGPEIKSSGTGLMKWVIDNPSKEIQGWENAYWNGITTLELAKCIEKYMINPSVSGIYHLVNNNNSINKFELLKKINQIFSLEKSIVQTNGPKSVNKILVDTRKECCFNISDYDTQLIELKNFMNE
jgi:dTDP-4-dehydrorhamnose reductase